MNWLTNVVRPKIRRVFGQKKDVPDNLWLRCPRCSNLLYGKELKEAMRVCSHCEYHFILGAEERFSLLFDKTPEGENSYQILQQSLGSSDPLRFRDIKRYSDRLKEARSKTQMNEAMLVAHGPICDIETFVAVQDFNFIAGSLGRDVGSAFVQGMEAAIEAHAPFVLSVSAGGARMQEGILSLMQMPRTTTMVSRLRRAHLPYIVIFTDPTMGGVTASYAMLGDIHLAEPGARIGFAGRRVIEQTIREELPPNFQTAEFLNERGFIDQVVHRHDLKKRLGLILSLLLNKKTPPQSMEPTIPISPLEDIESNKGSLTHSQSLQETSEDQEMRA